MEFYVNHPVLFVLSALLIAVVLGVPNSQTRFDEARAMLDYGFANYQRVNIANKGDLLKTLEFLTDEFVYPQICEVLAKHTAYIRCGPIVWDDVNQDATGL